MYFQFILFGILVLHLQYIVIIAQVGFLDSNSPENSELLRDSKSESLCSEHHPQLQQRYRYHNGTGTCYQTQTTGPCTNEMLFNDEDDVYGECDCDLRSERILIFHAETNRCYPIFSQGYCPTGHWLLLSEDFQPYCKVNLCYGRSTNDENAELVPLKGTCAQLYSKSRYCPENQVVTFIKDEVEPICGEPRPEKTSGPGVVAFTLTQSKFRCAPGSARSITGKCRPVSKLKL